MAELEDAGDLKSPVSDDVWVRIPLLGLTARMTMNTIDGLKRRGAFGAVYK